MVTGKDVAQFVTQMTGENYNELYNQGEQYEEDMKNEAKSKFGNMLERMKMVENANRREMFD